MMKTPSHVEYFRSNFIIIVPKCGIISSFPRHFILLSSAEVAPLKAIVNRSDRRSQYLRREQCCHLANKNDLIQHQLTPYLLMGLGDEPKNPCVPPKLSPPKSNHLIPCRVQPHHKIPPESVHNFSVIPADKMDLPGSAEVIGT